MGTRPSPERETSDAARVAYLDAARKLVKLQGQVAAIGLPLDPGSALDRVYWSKRQINLAMELAAAWVEVVKTRRAYEEAWQRYQRYGDGYR